MKKSQVVATIFEILSGLLGAAALAINFKNEIQDMKQIGCDENANTKN